MNENSETRIDPLLSSLVHHPVILAEVGKRITEIRVSLGRSEGKKKIGQGEFGQKIGGFSHTSVGRWEEGELLPDSETILKIAHLDPLQRGVLWLLAGDRAERRRARPEPIPAESPPGCPYSIEAQQTARFWYAVIFEAKTKQQQRRFLRWRRIFFDMIDLAMEDQDKVFTDPEQSVNTTEEIAVVAKMLDTLRRRHTAEGK